MSGLRLERWAAEDGPLTEKRLLSLLESEGYEVAVYAYRAGTIFPEHAHAQEKCDAVLEGVLRVTVDGVAYDLGGGRPDLPSGRHAALRRGPRAAHRAVARRNDLVIGENL